MPTTLPYCAFCGQQFKPLPGRSATQRFCSHPCAATFHRRLRAEPLADRFWSKVQRGDATACWEWQAYVNRFGYGQFGRDNVVLAAHRVAWELTNGPIPEGKKVLHRCDNPTCVNPAHLFIGTQAENVADMVAKERQRGGRRPPEQSHFAKLGREQVAEIRRLLALGTKGRALARQFGVSEATISVIKNGQTWRE